MKIFPVSKKLIRVLIFLSKYILFTICLILRLIYFLGRFFGRAQWAVWVGWGVQSHMPNPTQLHVANICFPTFIFLSHKEPTMVEEFNTLVEDNAEKNKKYSLELGKFMGKKQLQFHNFYICFLCRQGGGSCDCFLICSKLLVIWTLPLS